MTADKSPTPNLLTPGEVADLFRVDRRTVRAWADAGKLQSIRTLGGTRHGHRRYLADKVYALLKAELNPPQ